MEAYYGPEGHIYGRFGPLGLTDPCGAAVIIDFQFVLQKGVLDDLSCSVRLLGSPEWVVGIGVSQEDDTVVVLSCIFCCFGYKL